MIETQRLKTRLTDASLGDLSNTASTLIKGLVSRLQLKVGNSSYELTGERTYQHRVCIILNTFNNGLEKIIRLANNCIDRERLSVSIDVRRLPATGVLLVLRGDSKEELTLVLSYLYSFLPASVEEEEKSYIDKLTYVRSLSIGIDRGLIGVYHNDGIRVTYKNRFFRLLHKLKLMRV